MNVLVETDCPIFNKLVVQFQERMQRFFPECNKEILAMASHDYILNLKKDNVSWKPIIEKYIYEETGRTDKIIELMIKENEANGVYDEENTD